MTSAFFCSLAAVASFGWLSLCFNDLCGEGAVAEDLRKENERVSHFKCDVNTFFDNHLEINSIKKIHLSSKTDKAGRKNNADR